MKITYSHIEPEFQTDIEHETERHAEKLNRLLKRYAADLVYLHGSLEKTPRKTEFNFSVNLNLPMTYCHGRESCRHLRLKRRSSAWIT